MAGFNSAQSLEMRTEGEGVLGGGRMRLQRDEYEYTVFIYTDYTCMRKANTVSVFDDLDTLQPRFQRISSKTSEVCVCGGVRRRGWSKSGRSRDAQDDTKLILVSQEILESCAYCDLPERSRRT